MTLSAAASSALAPPLAVFGACWRAHAPQPPRRAGARRRRGRLRGRRPSPAQRSPRCRPRSRAEPDDAAATPRSAEPSSSGRARPATRPTTRAPRRAFAAALRRDPRDPGALVGAGTLALARHDFRRRAARSGARRTAPRPALARPYVVLADAQVELGRYGAAARPLQRLVDLQARTSPPTRASPTSASCTATSPARAARCGWRSPPAATPPRASPTCRRCSATSSSAAAGSARRAHAYRAALAALAGLPAGAGRARPRRRRRAATCGGAIARLRARRRAPAAARVRDRAGETSSWPPARRAAARRDLGARAAPSSACCARRASTPTSSSRCSRPTTAARARGRARAARLGARRRACARRTRSAGR